MIFSTERLWQFSLNIYPEKQKELLRWQDEHGANVNLALFCIYTDQHQIALTQEQIETLHQSITSFSKRATNKLRVLRREFKVQSSDISYYEQIKKHLLEAELLLEKQEQSLLVEQAQSIISDIEGPELKNWPAYQQLLTHKS